MIEIQGAPLIEHQIRWLKQAGICDIVINVHHLAEQLTGYLGSGSQFGVRIKFSRERELLNSGGGIAKALPQLGPHPFLLLNGDIWTNYQFAKLTEQRVTHAHLVLTSIRDDTNRDFAIDQGYVRRLDDVIHHNLTYCGIAVLHPDIFMQCPVEPFSLTKDLIFGLTRQRKVTGEVFTGSWIDIGSPKNLAILKS